MHEHSNDPAYVGAPETSTGMSLVSDAHGSSQPQEASSESASYADFSTGGDLLPYLTAVDTAYTDHHAAGVAAPVADETAAPVEPFRLDLVQMESAMVLAMIANEYFARTPLPTADANAANVQGTALQAIAREPVKLGLAGRMSIRSVKVKHRPHIASDTPASEWTARFEEPPIAEPETETETETEPQPEPMSDRAVAVPASPTAAHPPVRTTNVIAFPLAAKYLLR